MESGETLNDYPKWDDEELNACAESAKRFIKSIEEDIYYIQHGTTEQKAISFAAIAFMGAQFKPMYNAFKTMFHAGYHAHKYHMPLEEKNEALLDWRNSQLFDDPDRKPEESPIALAMQELMESLGIKREGEDETESEVNASLRKRLLEEAGLTQQ